MHRMYDPSDPNADKHALIEMKSRAWDAQKETGISLFHALLPCALGRVRMAANYGDVEFAALIARMGVALGKSRYPDGHQADWSQQFWAIVWEKVACTLLK